MTGQLQGLNDHTASQINLCTLLQRKELGQRSVRAPYRHGIFTRIRLNRTNVILVEIHLGKTINPMHVVQMRMGHRHFNGQCGQRRCQTQQVPIPHTSVDEQGFFRALHQVARGREVIVHPPQTGHQPLYDKLGLPVLRKQPAHHATLGRKGLFPSLFRLESLIVMGSLHMTGTGNPQPCHQALRTGQDLALLNLHRLLLRSHHPQGHIF